MADKLISKIPDGPLAEKWTKRKSELRLVNPNNRRKLEIIVVGTGLGGPLRHRVRFRRRA
jgi:succinate dehydrogenase subunit A (EC 1.3.5.1)